jgi:outer membrane protein assembly factor BamA
LVVREIHIRNLDVFDPYHEEFRSWPFRFLNRFHAKTRTSVIRRELLFQEGDLLDQDLLDESERNLRSFSFLTDVSVEAIPVNESEADVIVHTEDQWTTNPKISFGQSGSDRTLDFGIEESNFLGLGKLVSMQYSQDPEREGFMGRYVDSRMLNTRLHLDARFSTLSDGYSHLLALQRPFYSQDSRWSFAVVMDQSKRDENLYYQGINAAAVESTTQIAALSITQAWGERYRRNFLGLNFSYEESLYPTVKILDSDAAEQEEIQRNLNPEEKRTVSTAAVLQVHREEFTRAYYLDHFGKTEDLPYGSRTEFAAGYARNQLGSDFISLAWSGRWAIYRLESDYFITQAQATVRRQGGEWNNWIANFSSRYYHQKKNMNLGFFRATHYTFALNFSGTFTGELDIPYQVSLGGNDGLRGYDYKALTGEHRLLVNMEHRFFTPWDNRFAGIGIVPFVDAGTVWGADSYQYGISAGIGLRIAFKKYGRTKLIRIDYAYPLVNRNGSGSISISSGHMFNVM